MTKIAALTDAGSLERGRAYAASDRVTDVRTAANGAITARVAGNATYKVRLAGGRGTCDCPMGEDGVFCKHCVAVALTVVEQPESTDLSHWLDELDRSALIELVQEAARMSDTFANHLVLRASDIDGLKEQIDKQLGTRRFLDWREGDVFARDAQPLIDALADLVNEGRDAVALIERAIGRLTKVLGRADDSSGMIGGLLGRLLELHIEACRVAPPEPRVLVRWLVKYGLDDQDWVTIGVDDYAEILGEPGISAYRKEIERRLAAGDETFGVLQARERLAIAEQDVDTVVRLVGEDLTKTYQFVRVTEALRDMGLHDQVLDFALRGIENHADWQARQLYDVAADEYVRRGDGDAVVSLRWRELETFRDSSAFSAVRTAADEHWTSLRGPALDLLKDRPRDYVLCLLDDDPDAAWDAASANPDKVSDDLWLQLVGKRSAAHPVDVLPVYRSLIDKALLTADRKNYSDAVRLLKRMDRAARSAGDPHPSEFTAYVDELRELHRRRPTFMAMLGRAYPAP